MELTRSITSDNILATEARNQELIDNERLQQLAAEMDSQDVFLLDFEPEVVAVDGITSIFTSNLDRKIGPWA